MIDQDTEYRKSIRDIGKHDKLIVYRAINDMRWGTLKIERYEDCALILGQNKNNGGNMIKFAKIIPEEKHIENIMVYGLWMTSAVMALYYAFGLFAIYRPY